MEEARRAMWGKPSPGIRRILAQQPNVPTSGVGARGSQPRRPAAARRRLASVRRQARRFFAVR